MKIILSAICSLLFISCNQPEKLKESLNINELAHALRPVALPGEVVHVSILQAGSNRDQGVGYLDDGTMVVVDGAIKDIGKSIEVTIDKSHQTVAGKMLFAKKAGDANASSIALKSTSAHKRHKARVRSPRINAPNNQRRSSN